MRSASAWYAAEHREDALGRRALLRRQVGLRQLLLGLAAEVGADEVLHAGAVVEVDEERPHAARQLGPDAALLATEQEALRARRHRVVGAGQDDLVEAPVAELDVAVAAGLGHGRVGDVRRLQRPARTRGRRRASPRW